MVFPPELNTAQEKIEWGQSILKQIPEGLRASDYPINKLDFLSRTIEGEQLLVRQLKRDPTFMVQANARPPLRTFRIQKIRRESGFGEGLLPAWTELHRQTQGAFDLDALLTDWPRRSAHAFYSGLAQFIPKERRKMLSDPDLKERWRNVSSVLRQIPIEELRSRFKISAFGVTEKAWNWEHLENLAESISLHEDRLIIALDQGRGEQAAWFLSDESLAMDDASGSVRQNERIIEGLKTRARALYLSQSVPIEIDVVERELVLREVPPYLAVHRGCLGNDCSTDRSWAFPYSPFERVWFVEHNGVKIGYVTGNITMLADKPNLFIRDVAGIGFARGDNTLLLKGLYLLKESYGAAQMTIVKADWVGNNKWRWQQDELRDFGRGREPFAEVQSVTQHFQDSAVRAILSVQRNSSPSYDSIEIHKYCRSVVFPADADLGVRIVGADFEVKSDLKSSKEAFYSALSLAKTTLIFNGLNEYSDQKIPWQDLFAVIDNTGGLPAAAHTENLRAWFNRYNLPFSQNLLRKYETLFSIGYLQASDALSEENVKTTLRYVLEAIWRAGVPIPTVEKAKRLVAEHTSVFEESELFIRATNQLIERRSDVDAERILTLWTQGYRFRNNAIPPSAHAFLRETLGGTPDYSGWALDRLVVKSSGRMNAAGLTIEEVEVIAAALENSDEAVSEVPSLRAAEFFMDLRGAIALSPVVIKEISESIVGEENLHIAYPLSIFYVRQKSLFPNDGVVASAALAILEDHLRNGDLPQAWRDEGRELLRAIPAREAAAFRLIANKHGWEKRQFTPCNDLLSPK